MPGVQDRRPATTSSNVAARDGTAAHLPTHITSTPDQAKHWMKAHRTTIASGASSILSALAPMFSVTLVRTTSFSIYQRAKYKYSAAIGKATGADEPLVIVNRPGSTPTVATMACFGAAGGTAGALITIVACPFELTKMSAQISTLMANRNLSSMDDPVLKSSYEQKGTFKTAKNIVVNRGFVGMYSGFRLHLLRDTIGTTIYFTTYESTKQMLVKIQKSNSPTSPLSVALAGGFCGLVSWACIYPIDTAKTHYQRNCLSVGKGQPVKVPKIEFFNRKMYSGIGVSMARSCLINTIFFSSFEFIKKRINLLPDPPRAGEPME
ncbi:MAG: hypothetical protein Q9217_002363 [Psora testacea]